MRPLVMRLEQCADRAVQACRNAGQVDEKVKQDVAAKEDERKKYCEQVRTSLSQLKNNPRIRVTEENGEVRRIDENERQTRIQEAEKAIQEHCQE